MNFSIPAWLKNHTQPRDGSRAHLALFAGGGVAVAVVIAAGVTNLANHAAARALVANISAPTQPGQQVSTLPPTPLRGVAMATPAAPATAVQSTPMVDMRAPALAASAVPAAAVADAAPQNPPAGLTAGQVRERVALQDQFGQFTQAAVRVIAAPSTSWQSHVAAPGSPAWQETITGWINLSVPSTIATLRVGSSGAARTVSAEIDGASLGAPLGFGPASETAALSLSAGWHSFIVTAEGGRLNYAPPATPIELLIGNGTDALAPVVPYAATSQPAAAAHAATSAPVTSASPAHAQTAAAPASARVRP